MGRHAARADPGSDDWVLDMLYDMGIAFLERGKRLGEKGPLEQAGTIFLNIGANWDLSKVQEAFALFQNKITVYASLKPLICPYLHL